MTTERKLIHVLRHAEPGKDPETKRSLDYLTDQGKADAEALGARLYAGSASPIAVIHSPMFRAYQTGNRMIEGTKTVPAMIQSDNDLGLDFFNQAKNKPSGIAYGSEFINALLDANPEVFDRVAQEIGRFVKSAYQIGKGQQWEPTVLGISHGPKVEIGYGALTGVPASQISQFAANPLDGFIIEVDRAQRSGDILQAKIKFKDLEEKALDTRYLA